MAIKVHRERPSRRMHHRVVAPLFVTADGATALARDWSLGGLSVENFPGPLPAVGSEIHLDLCLPFQGFDIAFDAGAKVIRIDHDTQFFAVQFTELSERARELMQHFITEILRGSMVAIEDTIQRIDVPVTPVSTKPDLATPTADEDEPRVPWRTIKWSAAYFTLGFMVFGYIGMMLYANFFRLEVQTAVISAPIESVQAQFQGRIIYGDVHTGSAVKAGDVLLHVADNELEKSIDMAEVAVRERESKLAYLKRRQADEMSRMEGLATVTLKNLQQTELEVERLIGEARLAETRHARLSMLFKKGFTTSERLEDAEREMSAAKQRLESLRLELGSRMTLAKDNVGRRHYTGENFVGDIGAIDAEVQFVADSVKLAEESYGALLKHRSRLAVRAPFDGVVLDLPRVDRGSVREGDVIAVIEDTSARHVVAFLNQEEILKVGLGDEAVAYIPAIDRSIPLRVTAIDRTSGFIDEQEGHFNWRAIKDRSAKVTLEFAVADGSNQLAELKPGLPAIVILDRRSNNQMLAEVHRRLSVMFSFSGGDAPAPNQSAAAGAAPAAPAPAPSRAPASIPGSNPPARLHPTTHTTLPPSGDGRDGVIEVFERYNIWLEGHGGRSRRDRAVNAPAPADPIITSRPDLVS